MQIQLKNIQKYYGSVHANDDITLTIEPGQILGVLGENGAGKSTLMKILSGLISKDSGEIFIGREKQALSSPSDALRLGIGMLHQDPHDFPSMAIKEDLRIWDPSTRVKKAANDWQDLVEIQNDLGFHINLNGTVGELTVGERQQLELIRLLWLGVEVLILDEPTTGISAAQQEVLFSALKKLAKQGKTVIFVSHKLEEVKELCSCAVVLRKGRLIGERPAPFDENDLVKLMFGRQITRARTEEAGTKDVRLSIRNLNIEDFRINIENANLDLYAGEVIGLAGMEGSGQRQFLQTLAGLRQSTGGRIEFDSENINGRNCFEFQKRGIFYVPSARMEEGLVPGMRTVGDKYSSGEYFLPNLIVSAAGMKQAEYSAQMEFDQIFGAVMVFSAIILWVARHHLAAVLRQMFAPPRPGDPQGRYMPYRLAGWGFVACQGLLVAWLVAAGSGVIGAMVTVGMLSMLYLVLAKVVADTGLIYPLLPVPVSHPFELAATTALPKAKIGSYFFASLFSGILTHDLRQALPPYAQHAMAVADRAAYTQTSNWRKAIPFIGAIILALVVAYTVSGASTLFVEYRYAASLDRSNAAPINWWGSQGMVQYIAMDPTVRYANGTNTVSHNRYTHVGLGAGITAILGFMRLTVASWPIHPVGFLMCYTWGIRQIWFSIFLGWLAKVLIVHFGGSRLFSNSQSFFIGLILGEVLAAAWWLCVSLALAAMGYEYRAIALLP